MATKIYDPQGSLLRCRPPGTDVVEVTKLAKPDSFRRSLALVFALAFAACGKSQPATGQASTTSASTPPPAAAARPRVLVFCADWATPCPGLYSALDEDPLKSEMAGVDLQRIDCTDADDSAVEAVQHKWGALGMPTIIVLDAAGKELGRQYDAAHLDELGQLIARARRGS